MDDARAAGPLTWTKLGLVFAPDGRATWLRSHASLPTALPLSDGRQRVYFSSRDGESRSHVGWVELALGDTVHAGQVSSEPVLAPGPLGHFDDHGTYAASLVEDGGEVRLYYVGWNPGVRPPLFYSSIGLATSDDGGLSFRRHSTAPIMARSDHDPCLVTSPCVLLDGDTWRMWYVSGIGWREEAGRLRSIYHVKYAESRDGVAWDRQGLVAIDLRPDETNIARPCVVKDAGGYRMWYSSAGDDGYRIGYAESDDGYRWERHDELAGIEPGPEEWDAGAQAYPWLVRSGGREYLLYNGDGFGRDGFGAAVRPATA